MKKTLTESQKEALRQAATRELSRDEHLAVILHYYEAMTKQEIAAALEKSESEVTTLLNRARTKLRRAVQRAGDAEDADADAGEG